MKGTARRMQKIGGLGVSCLRTKTSLEIKGRRRKEEEGGGGEEVEEKTEEEENNKKWKETMS